MPEIIKIPASGRLDDAEAARIGAAAKGCRLIAFPTESSYALGSTGLIKAATRRILQVKERSTLKPLPVLVGSIDEAKKWVEWTPLAERLAAKLWPGAVSLLLKPTAQGRLLTFPEYPTVAIRVPSHPVAQAIVAASGVPWIYSSANKSGQPSLTDAAAVIAALGSEVDFVLDGATAQAGDMTTVDATGETARIVRQGLVTAETVKEAATA
jgi:L-threonylcarbamoyladenylate synthase